MNPFDPDWKLYARLQDHLEAARRAEEFRRIADPLGSSRGVLERIAIDLERQQREMRFALGPYESVRQLTEIARAAQEAQEQFGLLRQQGAPLGDAIARILGRTED
jgi:hypothetical protein